MKGYLGGLYRLLKALAVEPRLFSQMIDTISAGRSGYRFSRGYTDTLREGDESALVPSGINPLWEYFQNHKKGHGIWKWEHYFDIYHRHLARFVGRKVNVLEIGIYSGGSLEMWRSYFGKNSHIYGIDIEDACKVYENDHVSVFVGDQADRAFWNTFREEADRIDIVIDDGGHTPVQQQTTLEEMLPNLRPGGVYVCEDVHGSFNKFAVYATGLVHELNNTKRIAGSLLQSTVSRFQSSVHSIHFYPYVVVIEKHRVPLTRLAAPKHGTEWQPF